MNKSKKILYALIICMLIINGFLLFKRNGKNDNNSISIVKENTKFYALEDDYVGKNISFITVDHLEKITNKKITKESKYYSFLVVTNNDCGNCIGLLGSKTAEIKIEYEKRGITVIGVFLERKKYDYERFSKLYSLNLPFIVISENVFNNKFLIPTPVLFYTDRKLNIISAYIHDFNNPNRAEAYFANLKKEIAKSIDRRNDVK